MNLDGISVATTCGLRVTEDILPNGRRIIPLNHTGCCSTALIPNMEDGDCNECRNTGVAGPYPESMQALVEHITQAKLIDLPTSEPSKGWVIPCFKCHLTDVYSGSFSGIRSPIGTWLVQPINEAD